MALVSRFPSLGDMTAKKERSETSNKIFPKVFETKNKKVHYNGILFKIFLGYLDIFYLNVFFSVLKSMSLADHTLTSVKWSFY